MKCNKLDDIRDYIAFHGLKEFQVYELDDDILKTIQEIAAFDIPEFYGVDIPYIKKNEVRRRANIFFATKLLLHDVGFMSNRMLINTIRNNEIDSYDQLIGLYNSSGAIVSPYKIPIEYSHNNVFYGSLELQILVPENREILRQLLPKMEVFFNKITLAKRPTDISVSSYVHELMHSQLESYKGIVDNYYDSEVFSIFFELLYAYEHKDYYQLVLNIRLSNIFVNFNNMYLFQTEQYDKLPEAYSFYDYCSACKYVLSGLKAFSLLDKYLEGTYSVRKDILIRMQAVIDGLIKVSEFLEHYDIGYKEILDSSITNRLLRK